MDFDVEKTARTGGLIVTIAAILGGTLKGMFISKGECRSKHSECVVGVKRDIEEIKADLKRGNEKFA